MESTEREDGEIEKLGMSSTSSRSSRSSRTPLLARDTKNEDVKATKILEACEWRDLEALRIYAESEGGLISDEVRRLAWPLLLGCSNDSINEKDDVAGQDDWRTLPVHRDEEQVKLDVDRSFIYYPHDQSSKELHRRKRELSDLITEVLRRQPYLSYFQGYHDICQVFLLVLETQNRAPAVARLSALRIRDFMLPTFAQALQQLHLIPNIIHTVNAALWKHLSGIAQPFFALSGTLTMYAHDIQEYGEIARLFDVLLAREAVFSVYMFAQIVLQRADELFEIPEDEPEMLHSILSKLPRPLDIEKIIVNTAKLIEQHPPESLRVWRSISAHSVLKTARLSEVATKQSLADGEAYFKTQVKELKFDELKKQVLKTLWYYRRPTAALGGAVLIGVLSFWLRRGAGPSGLLGALWRYWSGYSGH